MVPEEQAFSCFARLWVPWYPCRMAQTKINVPSGSFKKVGSSARAARASTGGRTPAAAQYIAMSGMETDFPLAVYVADPRAPEALTQAIHRAMELSALSEVGHVVIHRHTGEISHKASLKTSTKADALAIARTTAGTILVNANSSGRKTPATAKGFDKTSTLIYGPGIAHHPLKGAEDLARKYRELREKFEELGLVITSTMRVRDQRFGDRKVQVEYFQDPELQGSVLMRLTPTTPLVHAISKAGQSVASASSASEAAIRTKAYPRLLPIEGLDYFVPVSDAFTGSSQERLPHEARKASGAVEAAHVVLEAPAALSTQHATSRQAHSPLIRTTDAAKMLGVSRPYITKLCDLGVFGPVEKTEGGQRRIPLAAVLAYQAQRRNQSQVLDEMAASETSARARAIELQAAEQAVAAQSISWTKVFSEPSASAAPSASVTDGLRKAPVKRASAKKVEASKGTAGKAGRA